MRNFRFWLIAISALASSASMAETGSTGDWTIQAGDFANNRYSALDQINASTDVDISPVDREIGHVGKSGGAVDRQQRIDRTDIPAVVGIGGFRNRDIGRKRR